MERDHLRERECLDRFLALGTESAFTDLFEVIYPQVRRFFCFRGFAVEQAEEMAQDVMVAVYKKASTLRDPTLFRTWLFKVAQNTLRQHRRRTHNDVGLQPLEDATALKSAPFVSVLDNAGFLDMISILNDEERQVMTLRYIDDLSYEEIAAVLGRPMGTVKWKIFDSKARISAHLRQNQPEHV